MLDIEKMKYWNLKEWQLYLFDLGSAIVRAEEINKKWSFTTAGNMEKNKLTNLREITGGITFILPDPYKI